MINSSLDIKALKREFAREERIRIPNILETEVAELIQRACLDAPFELVYVVDGKNKTVSRENMAAFSAEQRKNLNSQIMSAASRGEGYLYGSCHLGQSRPADLNVQLIDLFDYWGSEPLMEIIRRITGDSTINEVTGHYTRYMPGHFLT